MRTFRPSLLETTAAVLVCLLGSVAAWAQEQKPREQKPQEQKPCEATADHCLKEMTRYYKTTGWVGISMEPNESGEMTVTYVWPESPALEAGFREHDVLVAFDGLPYTHEKQAELKKRYKELKVPGKKVTFTVRRGDETVDVTVKLGTVPSELLAKMIGDHMLQAHGQEVRTAVKDP